MSEDFDLPPLTQQPLHHVDGAPDAEYPLRILRAYRQNCNCCWEVRGLDEGASLVYEEMNRHQEQRAAILDQAIATLEAALRPESAEPAEDRRVAHHPQGDTR